jgi:hypothetical protein
VFAEVAPRPVVDPDPEVADPLVDRDRADGDDRS